VFTLRGQASILSLLSILAILFLAPISIRSQDLSTPEIVAKCVPAVVCIQKFDRTGKLIGQGSGFFIAPGRILTAAHVVRGAYSLIVASEERDSKNSYFYQGKGITILKVDKDSDLAVLGVASADKLSLELEKDESSLRIGQSVVGFGNPGQCKVVASTGIIRGIYDSEIIVSAPAGHGASGGPICNGKGKVIGVLYADSGEVPLYAFAINFRTINKFLKTPDHPKELAVARSSAPDKPGFWKSIWTAFSEPAGKAANWLWVAAEVFVRIIGLVIMVCLGLLVLLVLSLSVARAIKKAYRTGLLAAMLLAASAIWIFILRISPRLVTALFEKKGLIWLVIVAPALPIIFFFMLRRRLRASKRTRGDALGTLGPVSVSTRKRTVNVRQGAVKKA